ncbi:hypothetical protein LTR97_012219 [Elasticomyces elasticus]|uniref:Uncharacterized protein n=1 Tax=Elasticomyces elasticus TaxID=574655 RepID=A0AAN7VKY1_9PEZI|nr:hypothetical protein LTR97_012219 [Elasticomyces elasticus]
MPPWTAKRTIRDASLTDDEAPLRKKSQLAEDAVKADQTSGDDRKPPETSHEIQSDDAYEAAKAEMIANYHKLYLDTAACHSDLEKHETILFEQATSFVELAEIVLNRLNDKAQHGAKIRLPRLSIKDLGQPKLAELISVQSKSVKYSDEYDELAARIRDAILVQCGSPVDDLRLGLTKCSERMEEVTAATARAQESVAGHYRLRSEDIEVAEDWCKVLVEAKKKLTEDFIEVVRDWRQTLIETKSAVKELRRQYRDPETPVEQQEDDEGDEFFNGTPHREDVAGPLARSIVAAYATLKSKFEAAFLDAVALAPLTFAYSGW